MNLSLKSFLPAADLGWNRVRARCGLATCHNKLLMRAVPQSRSGIHAGDLWYCSPDCFAAGSRSRLLALSMNTFVEMPRSPRLSLGLALLSKGYLTEEQLRFASLRSERRNQAFEVTLQECGLATDKQIAAARAVQWGYPVLAREHIGHPVQADLPQMLMRACSAAPVHYSAKGKRLVLGFVDRVEHSLLQAIEQMTGCRAEPCFITPAEYSEQLERMTPAPNYDEVSVEQPGTPAQMGRVLGGQAVEIAATEAHFAQCRSFGWVRLDGKRGTSDVIFHFRGSSSSLIPQFSTVEHDSTAVLA
jgi:hypothetical protein